MSKEVLLTQCHDKSLWEDLSQKSHYSETQHNIYQNGRAIHALEEYQSSQQTARRVEVANTGSPVEQFSGSLFFKIHIEAVAIDKI